MPDRCEYLDYAASAPLRPEALEAERAYDASPYAGANPNSLHTLGREAARARTTTAREVAAHFARLRTLIAIRATPTLMGRRRVAQGQKQRPKPRFRECLSKNIRRTYSQN